MRALPVMLLFSGVLGLGACGDDDDPEPPPKPAPPADCGPDGAIVNSSTNGSCQVKLGTGEETFVALRGGETLDVHHGPQGGFHVYGSLLARGIELKETHFITFEITRPDGEVLGRAKYCPYLESAPEEAGWRIDPGHLVILREGVEPESLEGIDAVLRVTLDDLMDDRLCAPPIGNPACRASACARVKLHDLGDPN